MGKIVLFLALCILSFSRANDLTQMPSQLKPLNLGPFTGLETTVGYIKKENGEKFLILETPEGTKLIKVNTDPKTILRESR